MPNGQPSALAQLASTSDLPPAIVRPLMSSRLAIEGQIYFAAPAPERLVSNRQSIPWGYPASTSGGVARATRRRYEWKDGRRELCLVDKVQDDGAAYACLQHGLRPVLAVDVAGRPARSPPTGPRPQHRVPPRCRDPPAAPSQSRWRTAAQRRSTPSGPTTPDQQRPHPYRTRPFR